jgi:hypothetical protein
MLLLQVSVLLLLMLLLQVSVLRLGRGEMSVCNTAVARKSIPTQVKI